MFGFEIVKPGSAILVYEVWVLLGPDWPSPGWIRSERVFFTPLLIRDTQDVHTLFFEKERLILHLNQRRKEIQ